MKYLIDTTSFIITFKISLSVTHSTKKLSKLSKPLPSLGERFGETLPIKPLNFYSLQVDYHRTPVNEWS